jgi:energy-coupling factor transport system ATP-binding protein
MSNSAISIKELYYRYRGVKEYALQDISLEMQKGEFLVIMGPSEAGKSTLVASLNGLVPHFHKGRFAGEVVVLGQNTRHYTVAEMAEKVGVVFQDFEAQLFSTNVELEVAFGPENFGVPHEEIAQRIEENLAYVGLTVYRRRPPSTLSGGQKQKLAIASVLAMRPQVLVMDEPATDLDPISKLGIFEIADRLRQRDDLTLVVVEHETEEVLHAHRILLLNEGQIVALKPAQELLREVSLMEEMGVMPLGVPKFFSQMGARELPLTPEEGLEVFKKNNWQISEQTYGELVACDTAHYPHLGEVLIRAKGLEHTYATGVQALKGVDLEIRRGEIVAIIGQNGSGKTTLVKHFNGLLMPTKGVMEVGGRSTLEQGVFVIGQTVGYVFQNPDHQIFSETVFDEVAFSLRLRNLPEAEVIERVKEALEAVGLAGYEMEDPFSLTKSGRQRVAVASVLAARPEVLILDEPTTGLDYTEQRGMMNLIKQLNQNGSTIIFITHHMWVVAEYAQRVYVINDGRIFLQGTTREVFGHEVELRQAHLRPPHLVSLSNMIGHTLLTVDEFCRCTQKGPA